MTDIAQSIDLNLSEKLQDPEYRKAFFLAESSAMIAEQLVALRKRREFSQKEVADLTGTKQPAISRMERADYQNWSFNALRGVADALDARIRVYIEPAEDVLAEYNGEPKESINDRDALQDISGDTQLHSAGQWANEASQFWPLNFNSSQLPWRSYGGIAPLSTVGTTTGAPTYVGPFSWMDAQPLSLFAQNRLAVENNSLKEENNRLEHMVSALMADASSRHAKKDCGSPEGAESPAFGFWRSDMRQKSKVSLLVGDQPWNSPMQRLGAGS